ncbi:MAG: hypothetical protein PHX05_01790 [Acidobacteriota bacterium]|jgi:hypothetical protein|nr:hypothetical protein [Acidobacteriota bacterium]
MKKALILLCGLLLVSAAHGAGSQMNFGLNFGIMTPDNFKFDPIMWTVGAELDFQLNDFVMLSPEVTLVGYQFKFKEFVLYPGIVLNFTPGSFFIGGGLVKGFLIPSDVNASSDVALKLNAGLMSRNTKLTVYLISDFNPIFKNMLIGASLGFRF